MRAGWHGRGWGLGDGCAWDGVERACERVGTWAEAEVEAAAEAAAEAEGGKTELIWTEDR